MNRVLVIVEHSETGKGYRFALAPEGMSCDDANAVVTQSVIKLMKTNYWDFEIVRAELEPLGFGFPSFTVTIAEQI